MDQHSLLQTLNLSEICLIQHRELATFVKTNTTLGIHHVFITKFTFKKKYKRTSQCCEAITQNSPRNSLQIILNIRRLVLQHIVCGKEMHLLYFFHLIGNQQSVLNETHVYR